MSNSWPKVQHESGTSQRKKKIKDENQKSRPNRADTKMKGIPCEKKQALLIALQAPYRRHGQVDTDCLL